MGAIHGFRVDANMDGVISQKEFQKAKSLGLDVSFMDKDGDGKVDNGVKANANSILVDNEERVYDGVNLGDKKYGIQSTSIFTNPDGSKTIEQQDDVTVPIDWLG